MRTFRFIAACALIFSVSLLALSGDQWLSINSVYREANDVYAGYAGLVREKTADDSSFPIDAVIEGLDKTSTANLLNASDTPSPAAPVMKPRQEYAFQVINEPTAVIYTAPYKTTTGSTLSGGGETQGNELSEYESAGDAPAGGDTAGGVSINGIFNHTDDASPAGVLSAGYYPDGVPPDGDEEMTGKEEINYEEINYNEEINNSEEITGKEEINYNEQNTGKEEINYNEQNTGKEEINYNNQNTGKEEINYNEGTTGKEEINYNQGNTGNEGNPGQQQGGSTPSTPSTPESFVDLASAMAINNEVVAWLYSPNTLIDYPVMRTDNYTYYIDHLPDGSRNSNGSLFIDYHNRWDFSGPLTIIYGHNMKSGKMFGTLPGYKTQSYYNDHPVMYIYTEYANYRLDIMYGFSTSEREFRENLFMYEQNVDSLVSFASTRSTFNSGVTYNKGDRVVALSTCTFEFSDARYIVLGILR